MPTSAAIRSPWFRAFLFGAAFAFAAMPARVVAQEATADNRSAPASEQAVTEHPPHSGYFAEPRILSQTINWAVDIFGDQFRDSAKSGFFVETSNLVTGSGRLVVGPGYRRLLFDRHAFVEASGAISWRYDKMVQGRFEFTDLANGWLALGSQAMWRDVTQMQYWGIGEDSLDDLRSQYRLKTIDVVGYALVRPRPWLTIAGDIGYVRRPTISDSSGWFVRDLPYTPVVFPEDPAVSLPEQPNYLRGGLSVTVDTRDHRGHPTRGGVYCAAWSSLRDQDQNTYTFQRYEVEAAKFIPLADERWVFAFHGWGVVSDVGDQGDVPFYMMPSLGGSNTIRAYDAHRFHDHNMMVVSAESRWALTSHVDVAAFFDAGNVARHMDYLNFDKTGYGVGLRLHTQRTTFGRLDVARGNGGWTVLLRTGDPFHLTRLSRRFAPIPFVP